jgi:hypothetical protein
MAEDKRPKIDLKARLGKTGTNQAPPAMPSGSIPGPPMSVPAPVGSIPAPTGLPAAAPSAQAAFANPGGQQLTGLASPFRTGAPPAPAATMQAQRIEVDEGTIQEARSGALKKAMFAVLPLTFLFAGVGYVAGGASEKASGRAVAREDAKALETDVAKSKTTLDALLKKTEAARDALQKGEFPEAFARELGAMNIDFTGDKLGARRFGGFKVETTKALVEYVTNVQEVNDRKSAVARLLGRMEKPMKDAALNKDKTTIGFVVIVGTKDPSGNAAALLAPLATALTVPKAKIELPSDFTFTDPNSANRANAKLDRYKGGSLDKPAVLYVAPGSVEKAFPSERSTAAGQLVVKLADLIAEIKGQAAAQGEYTAEGKPGLLERADRLIAGLQAAQKD